MSSGPSAEDRQVQAGAIVGASLACLHAAEAAWAESDGTRDLPVLLDSEMQAVGSLENWGTMSPDTDSL